jgi:hypothetical protein
MIDRQSVGPVRAVPEPCDRENVWRITRDDGRSKEIHHLDPLRTDVASPIRSPRSRPREKPPRTR